MASYFNVPPGCDNLWVKDPPRIVIYAARGRQTLGTAWIELRAAEFEFLSVH